MRSWRRRRRRSGLSAWSMVAEVIVLTSLQQAPCQPVFPVYGQDSGRNAARLRAKVSGSGQQGRAAAGPAGQLPRCLAKNASSFWKYCLRCSLS
jgi:hypothetical protein